MTTTTAPRRTLSSYEASTILDTYARNTQGRQAFQEDLAEEIRLVIDGQSRRTWEDLAYLVMEASRLGRTDRWIGAAYWAWKMLETGETTDAKWAVLQGSVWLAHANA
jgi:hypothetical protein